MPSRLTWLIAIFGAIILPAILGHVELAAGGAIGLITLYLLPYRRIP